VWPEVLRDDDSTISLVNQCCEPVLDGIHLVGHTRSDVFVVDERDTTHATFKERD